MTIYQLAQEWLEKHKNADEIWIDTKTGLPHEARYTRIHGVPRKIPAIYPFPPEWWRDDARGIQAERSAARTVPTGTPNSGSV